MEWAGKDVDLGTMLESGEIDALISADVPRCILQNSPAVGRLFEEAGGIAKDLIRARD